MTMEISMPTPTKDFNEAVADAKEVIKVLSKKYKDRTFEVRIKDKQGYNVKIENEVEEAH